MFIIVILNLVNTHRIEIVNFLANNDNLYSVLKRKSAFDKMGQGKKGRKKNKWKEEKENIINLNKVIG